MTAAVALWLASGPVAWLAAQEVAQPPAAAPAAGQAQSDQFVPVKSLPAATQSEQLPAQDLVMTAYVVVWAALLVYVWTVWRRLLKVEREMQALANRLKEKGA